MKTAPLRAVLDTNVLVSALLFEQGRLSWLRLSWQRGALIPVLAQPTAVELLRVLSYPKFRLETAQREVLLQELLPWSESWTGAIPRSSHQVRDPHDQVFLDLALAASVPLLISGDEDLLCLSAAVSALRILSLAEAMEWLSSRA